MSSGGITPATVRVGVQKTPGLPDFRTSGRA